MKEEVQRQGSNLGEEGNIRSGARAEGIVLSADVHQERTITEASASFSNPCRMMSEYALDSGQNMVA